MHVLQAPWPSLSGDVTRMAALFRQARRRDALLLIDDVGEVLAGQELYLGTPLAAAALLHELEAIRENCVVVLTAGEVAPLSARAAACVDARVTLLRPDAARRRGLVDAALSVLDVPAADRAPALTRAAALQGLVAGHVVGALRRATLGDAGDARLAHFLEALAETRGAERSIGFAAPSAMRAAPALASSTERPCSEDGPR
jgi:hypothetical protein